MKVRFSQAGILFLMSGAWIFAQEPALRFAWPVRPTENYGVDQNDYLDLYQGKHHLGADFNADDGTDYGDPVYAISGGEVVRVYEGSAAGGWGKVVVIRHDLPDYSIYSVSAHLSKIGVKVGDKPKIGDKIGAIGDGEGKYSPHLHLELRWWPWDPSAVNNPYVSPQAPITKVPNYLNPTLFINDHAELVQIPFTANADDRFIYFSVPRDTPIAHLSLEVEDETYSLYQALYWGLVGYDWYRHNGNEDWKPVSPYDEEVVFEQGYDYALDTKKEKGIINLVVPGHNYPQERAVQDMIGWLRVNNTHPTLELGTITDSFAWQGYDLRLMQISHRKSVTDSLVDSVWLAHATSQTAPLERWIITYNPATKQWRSYWYRVDPNEVN